MALCAVIRRSVRFIYSAVHRKPSWWLQILTKKANGSKHAHSNLHFTLLALGAVCNRVALLTRNDQRGCVDEMAWTDDISMTSVLGYPGLCRDATVRSRRSRDLVLRAGSLTLVSGSYTSLVLHADKAFMGAIEAAAAYIGIIFCTCELRSEDEGVKAFTVSHAMTNVQDFAA